MRFTGIVTEEDIGSYKRFLVAGWRASNRPRRLLRGLLDALLARGAAFSAGSSLGGI